MLPKGFGPTVPRAGDEADPRATLSRSQRLHLDRLIARYNAKTKSSKARAQAYRAHHADPRSAAGFNRLWKEMVYPIVVERSEGCYLYDIDGNRYVDMLNGFGPNFFGHNAPFIRDALEEQLARGIEVGPMPPLAGEAADLLCQLTGMDRATFVNTGSEAVQAAIRLARTVTGRDKVVVFRGDYHGNFDEVLVRAVGDKQAPRTMPMAPGIPRDSVANVLVLDYGSDAALELIAAQASDIAAVLVEPVQSRRPDFRPREFLHKLRALTEQREIVLVFDEVITGFRIAPGGAQEYYGVRADLATYGKVIGGGMPIGVVAGNAKLMDTFDGGPWAFGDDSFPSAGVTFFAGTFVRHPLAIAAAHASLTYLIAAGPALQEQVNRKTATLADGLNALFRARGVKIEVAHFASQMFVRVKEDSELATLFFYHLRARGIHILENFPSYMTAAHDDAAIEAYLDAAHDSLCEMQSDGILPAPPAVSADTTSWQRQVPLTLGQHELWIAAQLSEAANCAFNESDSIQIDGPLRHALFEQAVAQTLAAHEALQMRFRTDGSAAIVDPAIAPRLETRDVDDAALEAFWHAQATTPFDLQTGPLVRAHLLKLAPERHVFVIYGHHLVFDGFSADLVIREVIARYEALLDQRAATLPDSVPFSLYAAKRAVEADSAADMAYWREIFADGAPAPLDLPTDHPRPARRDFAGDTLKHALPSSLLTGLRQVTRARGLGLNALLTSAFAALLSRLSGQEDFIVGVPVAGQARFALPAVGYGVTIVPIRSQPGFERPFIDLAQSVQTALVDGFEHQELSISALASALGTARDRSRLPLIEVVFNHSRFFAELHMGPCRLHALENPRRAVLYDLFCNVSESDDALTIDCDYATGLFERATIARWLEHYQYLLEGVVSDAAQRIGDLPLMSNAQTAAMVSAWQR